MRIVSLVPSITELLFDLGLNTQVVGVTRFCTRPELQVKKITKIGGTKSIKIERIISLKPDLVIANKEENTQMDIVNLEKSCNVWVTNIFTLKDTLNMISDLGLKTNTVSKAQDLISEISNNFKLLHPHLLPKAKKSVAYLIWQDPLMLAGQNTFINNMLNELNWENIVSDKNSRYPEVTETELQNLKPDLILLSSEPYPFNSSHKKLFMEKFPNSKTILVDGELFSWYGSRLKYTPGYFKRLLNEVEKK